MGYTIIALVVSDEDAEDLIADGRAVNYGFIAAPNLGEDEANGLLDIIERTIEDSGVAA